MNSDKKLRSLVIFCFFCFMYTVILLYLCYLQIIRKPFFSQLGKQQYNVSIITNPPRALIYDRNNKIIALNTESTSAFILPSHVENPERLRAFLCAHYPTACERWNKNQKRHFLYIKRRLTQEDMALMQEEPDIKFLTEPSRFYPVPALGTVLGVTDIDNHGLFGIERMYDERLAGTPSLCTLERDARSGHFYFNKKIKTRGKEGLPVHLTLDSDIQRLAYNELQQTLTKFESHEGGVVVINPETGDIIACACIPDFDPNNTQAILQENTKCRPFTQAYEAGSVIKVFASMAALEEGVVTPSEPIDCEKTLTTYINGLKVNTTIATDLGVVPFSEVIEKSNNIGTVKVVMRVGTKLYDHYKRLGFTHKTAVNFPGEQAGYVTPPERWSKRSIISLSFGYEIQTTMMQLAQAFCLIANNGCPVSLRLVKSNVPVQKNTPVFSQHTIHDMHDILTRTVEAGTGRRARIKGYQIMGKTGTANLAEHGAYNENKNLFTFCGIVQKGDYTRVIVTYVKEIAHPTKHTHAASVAAPLFERVAENMLIHDNIIEH